jgi:hypothetical protein
MLLEVIQIVDPSIAGYLADKKFIEKIKKSLIKSGMGKYNSV